MSAKKLQEVHSIENSSEDKEKDVRRVNRADQEHTVKNIHDFRSILDVRFYKTLSTLIKVLKLKALGVLPIEMKGNN